MTQALLIIDVQNDFLPPDGALAVPDGEDVIAPINELLASDRFGLVIATRDWHPPDHHSFKAQGGPWPEHCVQDTAGARASTRPRAAPSEPNNAATGRGKRHHENANPA